MSQPAVTHQLKLLEQRYGRQFYRKTGQGIALTESGAAFLAAVKPVLEEVAKSRETVRGSNRYEARLSEDRGNT